MKPRAAVATLLLAGLAFGSVTAAVRGRERAAAHESRIAAPPEHFAPAGERIRVQVLNGTNTRGLARRATMYLRDLGYDVVDLGNAQGERESTLVVDRSIGGRPDWARRIADALGNAATEHLPDTSRYLDVTIILGTSWRPPAEPFYP